MKSHGQWYNVNNIIIYNQLTFLSIVLLLLFVMIIMKWRNPTWIEWRVRISGSINLVILSEVERLQNILNGVPQLPPFFCVDDAFID
jgi:hypothetical protein